MKPIVIYGCGYSLNELSNEQWDELRQYDSIGFNWFIHQKWIAPTYMLVGDIRPDKNIEILGKDDDDKYAQYNIAVKDKRYDNTRFYMVGGYGDPNKINRNMSVINISENHWNKSATIQALYICRMLGYKTIIYAGVDLYDYRFFFLEKDQVRIMLSRKEHKGKYVVRKLKSPHPVYKKILSWFNECCPEDMGVYSYNPKSLLLKSKVVKLWSQQ